LIEKISFNSPKTKPRPLAETGRSRYNKQADASQLRLGRTSLAATRRGFLMGDTRNYTQLSGNWLADEKPDFGLKVRKVIGNVARYHAPGGGCAGRFREKLI